MEDALKKFLYAGVGLANAASEKIQNTVDHLIEKGKMTDEEGRNVVDDFLKSTAERKADLEEKLKKTVETIEKNVSRSKELKDLQKRIEELENKVEEFTKEVVSPKESSS